MLQLLSLTIGRNRSIVICSAFYRYQCADNTSLHRFVQEIGVIKLGYEVDRYLPGTENLDHIINIILLYRTSGSLADILPWSRVCPLLRLLVQYVIWCRYSSHFDAFLYMYAHFATQADLERGAPFRGSFIEQRSLFGIKIVLNIGHYLAALDPEILTLKFPKYGAYLNTVFVHQTIDRYTEHIPAIPFDLLPFMEKSYISTWSKAQQWYQRIEKARANGFEYNHSDFQPDFSYSNKYMYAPFAYINYKPEYNVPFYYNICCTQLIRTLSIVVEHAIKDPLLMKRLISDLGVQIPPRYPRSPFKIFSQSTLRSVMTYVLWCLAFIRRPDNTSITYFQADKMIQTYNPLILSNSDWTSLIDQHIAAAGGNFTTVEILSQVSNILSQPTFTSNQQKRRRLT